MTDRWRPAPPQTGETLELVGDLRQEALHAAEMGRQETRYVSLVITYFLLSSLQRGVVGEANDT